MLWYPPCQLHLPYSIISHQVLCSVHAQYNWALLPVIEDTITTTHCVAVLFIGTRSTMTRRTMTATPRTSSTPRRSTRQRTSTPRTSTPRMRSKFTLYCSASCSLGCCISSLFQLNVDYITGCLLSPSRPTSPPTAHVNQKLMLLPKVLGKQKPPDW